MASPTSTGSGKATSSQLTPEPSTRASTATPPSPWASARSAPDAARLIAATEAGMWAGIAQVEAGNRLGDIGSAVQAIGDRPRLWHRARIRRPRDRPEHARRAPGFQSRGPGKGHETQDRHGALHRAHVQLGGMGNHGRPGRVDRPHRRWLTVGPLRAHSDNYQGRGQSDHPQQWPGSGDRSGQVPPSLFRLKFGQNGPSRLPFLAGLRDLLT